MIGLKTTTILTLFQKKNKKNTFNIGMWGVCPEAIDWNIVLHTQILFWMSVSEVRFKKKHLQSLDTYKIGCIS